MKKFLSILLAVLMIVGLVPALFAGAATGAAGKSTAVTADKNGRTYHYYESFDTNAVVQGADKVFKTLGWSLPDDAVLVGAHESNVAATEKDGVYMYELKNGRLYLRNRGSKDEYMLLGNAGEMAELFDGAYVIEYTMTYLASSTSTADGYVSLIYNATDRLHQYGELVLRISGWGNSRMILGDVELPLDRGDVSSVLSKECGLTAYRVDNDRNMTLYEKLCGNVNNVPGTANVVDVRGTKLMTDVEMRVRMEFDGENAPTVYVNDIVVSDPRNIRDEAIRNEIRLNYQIMMATGGSCLAFCVTPGIDCVLDEITVYETRTAVENNLFITEVATLPGNPLAPYIEVYNAGNEAVDLSKYAVGYVALDAASNENIVGLSFADYIGQSVAVNDVTLDNLAAEDAMLNPGEFLLVFPVDLSADVADLIATVDGVTMAGFRAEYGLDANAKVVAVYSDSLEMDATEHRYWFVADAYTEKGKPVVWAAQNLNELKNAATTQSIVELVPTIAFGYEGDINDTSVNADGAYNFGGDGYIQAGYSAHYLYGANVNASAKVGLMISRCTELIKETNGVGALLDVQYDYFEKIAAFRAGHYVTTGSLAITEMIPATDDGDAFEAFEVTNISEDAINLYDFGLVSSGDAKYGSLSNWTRASLFELNPVEDVVNPSLNGAFMVEPGVSVVIWNMTVEGYTVADFRQYHGIAANIPVVAVASFGENGVVAANKGTVSYGVASAADIKDFRNGKTTAVAKVVSDVTVPIHSIHYEIDGLYKYTWDELYAAGNLAIISAIAAKGMAGCEMLGVNLEAGAALAGYFTREEVDGKQIYVACADDAVVPAEDAPEYFMPKDTTSFYVYGSKQTIDFPADYAISFSYGSGIYADKSSGSLLNALQVSSYEYDTSGRGFGDLPYLLDVANRFAVVELTSGASANHTLGKTVAKQGVNIAVKFHNYYTVVFLDGNGQPSAEVTMNGKTCGDVYTVLSDEYDSWLVNDVFYNPGDKVSIDGDTVIKPGFLGVSQNTTDANAGSGLTVQGGLDMDVDAGVSASNDMTVAIVVVSVVAGVALIATVCTILIKKKKSE